MYVMSENHFSRQTLVCKAAPLCVCADGVEQRVDIERGLNGFSLCSRR